MTKKATYKIKKLSDIKASVGAKEIVGGVVGGVGTFLISLGHSHKKHMIENGFVKGEMLSAVDKHINKLAQEIEGLEYNIQTPKEFFKIDIDGHSARSDKISNLRAEKFALEEPYKKALDAVMRDVPLLFLGSVVAGVVVGTGIYFTRQHMNKPDKKVASTVGYEGRVTGTDEKKEPSL
jgi:hypothetical protein